MTKYRLLTIATILLFIAPYTQGQNINTDVPLSMLILGTKNIDAVQNAIYSIPAQQFEYNAPDTKLLHKGDSIAAIKPRSLCRIGTLQSTDLSPLNSGKWTTLPDGDKIWRLQVKIADAQALGLFYDKFYLPAGAKYFVFNESGTQIVGFTSEDNTDDGMFGHEKIQGSLVNIELDLPEGINVSSVSLHINKVGFFYRGATMENLQYNPDVLTSTNSTNAVLFPYGNSSPCEINAVCSLGANNVNQRNASVTIQYSGPVYIYAGSGTLLNNTKQDCSPYVLTASHVEPNNSTSNSTFSSWGFYFNYQTPTCTYTGAQPSSSQFRYGATFVARASYDSSSSAIYGDFLLVKLKQTIPSSYGAYLNGWDNSGNIPSGQCIGFHHPGGDVKKVSATTQTLDPNGSFNTFLPGTHWQLNWTSGGTEEGSSGSGLFDSNNHLIGDLSGGPTPGRPKTGCMQTNSSGVYMDNEALYSKTYYDWYYTYQQPSTASSRLADWLDPVNGGATATLDGISYTMCQSLAAATSNVAPVQASVTVYPNPTKGNIYAKVDFSEGTNLKIEVYNVLGQQISELNQANVTSGNFQLDLSNQAAGFYLVKVSTNSSSFTKKVLLVK